MPAVAKISAMILSVEIRRRMSGIDLCGDGDRRSRTVEGDAAIEGITRREMEGVV